MSNKFNVGDTVYYIDCTHSYDMTRKITYSDSPIASGEVHSVNMSKIFSNRVLVKYSIAPDKFSSYISIFVEREEDKVFGSEEEIKTYLKELYATNYNTLIKVLDEK